MSEHHILIIEDDLDIANVLKLDLTDAGCQVDHADVAMTGLIKAREDNPDLIILDLGLPDFDGGDVVQRLRKNSAVPIIVLTARDTVDEKVRLLGLGADDYIIKPFHPDELLARVKVQLRQRVTESLTMGDLTLDPQKRLATYKGEELRLSPKEFDILSLLIRQPGRVYSRAEIGQEIWQGRLPEGSNVVDVHMANLRAKLRDLDGYGLLRTVRGVGYALRG
ncbi:response regulator transcription factor [Deinococcus sp. Marseille-Q6407]|uniref:response regulator transcription factor n=1 Tax=Deinococcus sp. Marseille-Q6407 TaxID=2969223 RepID=UPI0021BF79FA|nr:response regulator transcription factor [Deinococcus sp. Marseille-Q6407]